MSEILVTLKSKDNVEFVVEKSVAFRSTTIQNLGGRRDSSSVIELPEVNSFILRKVIEYLQTHADSSLSKSDLDNFDMLFAEDEDINVIIELIIAANYLDIPDLAQKMCKVVASDMESMSVEGVRKMFGIAAAGDIPPDEEARLRKEYEWAFEEVPGEFGEIGCILNGDDKLSTTDMTKSNGGTPAKGIDVGGNDSEGQIGEIGCMVNGAELEIATRDVIKLHRGTPANVIVVAGNASEGEITCPKIIHHLLSNVEQIVEAFKNLTSDDKVKAILVNIFGGTMECDVIATGIVNAAKKVVLKVPVVVRLEGTNVDQGKRILKESGTTLVTAEDLDDAVGIAVRAAAS
ncbi:hypothetical protein LguiB_000475 [Lonicera macranthoides]